MADDLTALLRQTLREDTLLSDMLRRATEESGRRWLDALAVRLAEVVREVYGNVPPDIWRTKVARTCDERDAARKSESEAVALLTVLVAAADKAVRDPDPEHYRWLMEKARAYLARREESP